MDAIGISPPSESSTIDRKITAANGVGTLFVVNLPEEIVIHILTRLPVKSLLKFRCVSKSWCSIISSPSFAKSHLLQASENGTSFPHHRLMLEGVYPIHGLLQSSLHSVVEEEGEEEEEEESQLIDSVTINYPQSQPRFTKVLGSHNGVLCISTKEEGELLLWNPTTKVHFILPKVDFHPLPMVRHFDKVISFGYSKSSDDYKVLIIFRMFTTGGVNDSVVKIYSQKSNSWKIMESYNYKHMMRFYDEGSGKLVNGKLHFVMLAYGEEVWEIVYIDLDSETDGIIEQPDCGNGRFGPIGSSLVLGVFGGSLCVLRNGILNADLWVLKEYGVKESWTKLVTIQCLGEVGKFVNWNPLFMLPTGKILLACRSLLIVYNPRYNTWTYPKIRNVHSFRDAFIHVESLVSPLLNAN